MRRVAALRLVRQRVWEFSWRGKIGAQCHIEALISKGWLEREAGKAQSLRPLHAGRTIPSAIAVPRRPEFGELRRESFRMPGVIGPPMAVYRFGVFGHPLSGGHNALLPRVLQIQKHDDAEFGRDSSESNESDKVNE